MRLTTAQALVRWLQMQHSERDGKVQRAVPALPQGKIETVAPQETYDAAVVATFATEVAGS